MARSTIIINKLKAKNERLKQILSTATMFWDVVYHLNMQNWEPALKARIESLTHDNRQLDEAYTKARAILDKEIAELRAKNTQLENEADWLADMLVDLCQHRYESDCRILYDPEVASRKRFREAAQCQAR